MNKKLKAKWLRALRGGQYQQGESRLVSDGGNFFCCLGVLADIQGCVWQENSFGSLHPIMPRGRGIFSSDSEGRVEGGYLKPAKAGGIPLRTQKALGSMNDGGKSFKQIANWIQENL